MVIRQLLVPGAVVCLALAMRAEAQDFSRWIEASGMVRVEYRWRADAANGCEVEYRSSEDRGRRRYKMRVVFQSQGEERDRSNTILAFENGVNTTQNRVAECSLITDVTVTGW